MYDTYITVLGNVATAPTQRIFESGTLTDFRVASSSRRFDKRQEKWVNGDELFVRVSCWRTLGQHVYKSIRVGDPVIVRGRLFSRRYTDDNGNSRYVYEIKAQAVGHDLSRGLSQFVKQFSRSDPSSAVDVGERAEFDALVNAMSVPGLEPAGADCVSAAMDTESTALG
jgi:single-strand DNA-binding protein